MLKEKQTGKSADFRTAKKGQDTGLEFVLVWTISHRLTKVPNEKSLPVSAAELMEMLLAPLHGNSDPRLKHPLKKPDFTSLATGSMGDDNTSPKSVGIKYMILFFFNDSVPLGLTL